MYPSRRFFSLLALSVAAAVSLAACASSSSTSDASTAPARVNQTDISDAELATATHVFQSIASVQQVPCGTKDGPTDTDEAACNRFTLGYLIQFKLAQDYAAANGVTVTDADIAKVADNFEANFGKDVFQQQLDANGATRDQFIDVVRVSLVQNEVEKAIAAAQLSDADLLKQYQDAIADYSIIQVDHILVKTEAEAKQVYQQVTAPGVTEQDFLDLAKKISIDPTVDQNSGSLGSATASQYVPEFATAALALKPGEISQPVQTQFGWHVIRMVDTQVTPFSQAKDQIVQSQMGPLYADWVREQNAAGAIVVNPSFGIWDDQQLTVLRISSTDPSATAAPTDGASPSVSEGSGSASPQG